MTKTSGLAPEQVQALMARLNPSRVAKREGPGGKQLSYLEAFDVKATLIRVFGFAGFSAETIEARILRENWYQTSQKKDLVQVTALCTVRLTIHQTGAVYQESGAASQSGPDHGEVCDFAIKTAESDALKRAATYLGTQFGLSLYANGQTTDVVRVLIEPHQHDMLDNPNTPQEGTGGDLSPEGAAALEHSLGAVPVSEAPSGVPEDGRPDSPRFERKIDTPTEAQRAVEAMTESAKQRGVSTP